MVLPEGATVALTQPRLVLRVAAVAAVVVVVAAAAAVAARHGH